MWHKLLVRAAPHGFLVRHQKYLEDWAEKRYASPLAERDEILNALSLLRPKACTKTLIRVGGSQDGAYLVPDDFKDVEACFSPGVEDRFEFEKELSEKYGIPAFLCDGSIGELDTGSPLITFSRKWLAAHSDATSQTLDHWMAVCHQNGSQNLIMQMDIEGWEYLVILAASYGALSRFRIITLELHGLQDLDQSRFLNLRFLPVLKKLREIFDVVHLHPNNACGSKMFWGELEVPNVVELTLYRRTENVAERMYPEALPHPLDILNDPDRPLLCPGFPLTIPLS